MSQQFIPHPPSPQPNNSKSMKQASIIVLLVGILVLLIAIFASSGTETSSSDTTSVPASVVTQAPAPVVNKYDTYLEHVYNNSGKANTMDKSELIEFGDVVCQALDNGKTIGTIVGILEDSSSDTRDAELYASIVFGAITYICDEYTGDLSYYLNN